MKVFLFLCNVPEKPSPSSVEVSTDRTGWCPTWEGKRDLQAPKGCSRAGPEGSVQGSRACLPAVLLTPRAVTSTSPHSPWHVSDRDCWHPHWACRWVSVDTSSGGKRPFWFPRLQWAFQVNEETARLLCEPTRTDGLVVSAHALGHISTPLSEAAHVH